MCVYLVACFTGLLISGAAGGGFLLKSAQAVLGTVVVIYAFSFFFNNSSVFDPYWSIAPPLMVLLYISFILGSVPDSAGAEYGAKEYLLRSPRILVLLLLTLAYCVRLTWNFLKNWPGMKHEDWRYADFRANTGKAYWLVSLAGIHLFPAIMVFGGTLSIWVTVIQGNRPVNFIDLLAILVTGFAILLEAMADKQLRAFLAQNTESGKTMDQGLWSLSRHPNYLGEILFWWGLYLFAIAANPAFWWVIVGPMAITLMFIFASIPMIEKRMLKRRNDYEAYREKVCMLIPWKKF